MPKPAVRIGWINSFGDGLLLQKSGNEYDRCILQNLSTWQIAYLRPVDANHDRQGTVEALNPHM
jgi:hypothetical protein